MAEVLIFLPNGLMFLEKEEFAVSPEDVSLSMRNAVNEQDSEKIANFSKSNARGKYGETIFHWLALNKISIPIIEAFKPEALIDPMDVQGRTPLHKAAECGITEVLAALFEKGADLDKKDSNGETAKDLALRCGRKEAYVFLEQKSLEKISISTSKLDESKEREKKKGKL